MDWLNTNGLIDGDVPAGQPCPFWNECGMRVANCPSHTNQNIRMNHGFSCAAARAFSLIQTGKMEKAARGQA